MTKMFSIFDSTYLLWVGIWPPTRSALNMRAKVLVKIWMN